MQDSPPFFFAAVRTMLGGLLVVATAVALRRSCPVGWRTHTLLALSGVLNYAVFYGGLNYGVMYPDF
jgi:drug/metabolite transporter (DMT)-like permease